MREQDRKQADNQLEELKRVLKSRAEDNRISCTIALQTAAEFEVSPAVVGNMVNDLRIKITGCQLGCF